MSSILRFDLINSILYKINKKNLFKLSIIKIANE
jgi:hypothetical protein